MTPKPAPDWLADLQARFGSVIRTPLDRSTGSLRAVSEGYDPVLRDAASPLRLAVYNRQYWFRLFEVLHATFPLTTRLVGHWQFNDFAQRFLLEHPPRGWDIDRVGDEFEGFFPKLLTGHPHASALVEACRIDRAWHDVFRAPAVNAYRPTAADAARLIDSRLVPSPAVVLLEEHWPLSALRRSVLGDAGEAPVPVPPALPVPRAFVLARTSDAIVETTVEMRELELLRLLAKHSVRDALGILEAACTEEERTKLPEKARVWLARSVERGAWTGAESAH